VAALHINFCRYSNPAGRSFVAGSVHRLHVAETGEYQLAVRKALRCRSNLPVLNVMI